MFLYLGNFMLIYGINGLFLLLIIVVNKNDVVILNVINNLNVVIIMYWYGLYVVFENDGGLY